MREATTHTLRFVKPAVFVLCLAPFARLLFWAATDRLGANPIDAITDETGTWTLRFLAIILAVTPLRRLSGWHKLVRYRRMLGLVAFFYGLLHFVTYIVLDRFFAFDEIIEDVAKRPYVTVGFTAFVLMIPLAATSTAAMIRRLGGRRWQLLHRLVYLSALGGVVHYWWLVKADLQRPQIYATIVAALLGFRVVAAFARRRRAAEPGGPGAGATFREEDAALT